MSNVSTKDLKRVLGRKELMTGAIGSIIGAGIFTITGLAIGIAGKSVIFSFAIATIIALLGILPTFFASGTVRMRGGNYTHLAILGKQRYAGMFIFIHICTNLSISLFALSFAQYFAAIVPGLNIPLIAFLFMLVITIFNILGIENAAKLQNIMVLVMAVALTLFTAFGILKVQPGYFTGETFMPSGVVGIITAGALLSLATSGAGYMVNFSAEAKDPIRDIPFVIIVSTIIVSLFYAGMGYVAAGVLPIEQVANQPLNVVAAQILPAPVYVFFIVGGALFALSTTVNTAMGWMTKPIIQACADGWLPKGLGKVNSKYKTPHWLLLLFFSIGIIPVLIGWDLTLISNLTVTLFRGISILLAITTLNIHKVLPEEWENSKFKISKTSLKILMFLSIAVNLLSIILLVSRRSPLEIAGNIILFILAYFYGLWGEKSGKIDMEVSYEKI